MKTFIFVVCLAVAYALPEDEILRQSSEVNPDGSYEHSYETGNGIKAEEHGVLKNAGSKDGETQEVTGSFEYSAPDGTKYAVHYVANEHGFQPEAAHLPVAPEIPAYILRSLEWNAAHPEPEEKGEKFLSLLG